MKLPYLALALALLVGPAEAQYAIDVKTTLSEKRDLQVVKQGVLNVLEEERWASVTETGEDYSLWLTEFKRAHHNDSIYVSLGLNLRTPAMLTRGDHIDATRIQISYHWNKAERYARDSVNTRLLGRSQDFSQLGSSIGRMAGMVASVSSGLPGVEQFGAQLSGPLVGKVFQGITEAVQQDPNAIETMEALLVGRESADATRMMIRRSR